MWVFRYIIFSPSLSAFSQTKSVIWLMGFPKYFPNTLSQNMTLWYILSCRHLKNSKHKERFSMNSTYLPKDRTSKGNSTFIDSRPRVASTREDCYHWKDYKLTPYPNSITIIPPICSSKDLFIFPKNHTYSKIHTFL